MSLRLRVLVLHCQEPPDHGLQLLLAEPAQLLRRRLALEPLRQRLGRLAVDLRDELERLLDERADAVGSHRSLVLLPRQEDTIGHLVASARLRIAPRAALEHDPSLRAD